MSLTGTFTLECDRPTCRAELVLGYVDADLEPRRKGGIDLQLYAPDWCMDEDGSLICPQCAAPDPREKGDDDGREYADPRDARDEAERD